LEVLFAAFNKKLNLKIDPQKKNSQWVIFGRGVISAAVFLSDFQGKDEI